MQEILWNKAWDFIEGLIIEEYRMTICSFEETSVENTVPCQNCTRKAQNKKGLIQITIFPTQPTTSNTLLL